MVGQKSLFGPFVRLKNKKQGANVQGLNLGLMRVRALVEAMGGKIALVSRERLTTRFTVQIRPL
jgi:signal transduction histidine kinase